MAKKMNQYTTAISPWLYEITPKAVFAAIAAGAVFNGGVSTEHNDTPDTFILREWQALFNNGIVPQKPPTQNGKG